MENTKQQIQNLGFSEYKLCNYNKNYAVTPCGNVIRVCREQKSRSGNVIKKHEAVLLKGSMDKDGYKTVRMMVDGKKRHIKVHRLIANAYIQNKSNKPCVNHIDGNKQNNQYKNLEWCTVKENNIHALKNGLTPIIKGDERFNTKISTKEYENIYNMNVNSNIPRKDIAKYYGVVRQTIDTIINKVKNANKGEL